SSQLDVRSQTKGFLLPRLDQSQRNNIADPAQGLIIFQTDNTPGFYIYGDEGWARLETEIVDIFPGDVKDSYQSTNHEGWYLLNGQSVSSLPAAAQMQAASLGIGTVLPDTRDRIAKHAGPSGEASGSLSAANVFNIIQSNLPNTTLTTS